MVGYTKVANKRKRSKDQDEVSRPRYRQLPPSESHRQTTYHSSLARAQGSRPASTDRAPTPSETSRRSKSIDAIPIPVFPVVLLLSDQDVDLLDFPDVPPVTIEGSCELYIAVHQPTNTQLAMKRPRVDFPTEDMLRRFRREAEIWSEFKHPNILPFFGTMKISHWLYIVSPWMPLGDLLAFVQTRTKLIRDCNGVWDEDIPLAYRNFSELGIIREIAAGLAYLHSIKVVHGDMKAKNVLLTNEGRAQICDFGLTKTLSHSVTSTELRGVGSIRWQSPELLQNVPKSPKSDIYALGMTISEVLTGDYPFPHLKEQSSVIFAVMLRDERPQLRPSCLLGVDFRPLWTIAAWCWRTNTEDRPDVTEVVQRLIEPPIGAICKLSEDILQSIFLIASNSILIRAPVSFSVTLSHVCQSWRKAAINLPSLWSLIRLDGLAPFPNLRLFLERSKGIGLDIEIQGDGDIELAVQLARLLKPHMARWRSLKMAPDFKAEYYRQFFQELRRDHMPRSEGWNVANSGSIGGWEFQPLGGGAPRLSSLSVGASHAKSLAVLYAGLTELSISQEYPRNSCGFLTSDDLLSAFALFAPTIRVIYIDVYSRRQESSLPHRSISLPCLQRMAIDKSWIPDIYMAIVAPAMQNYDLDVSILEHFSPPSAFPFPNLSNLTISQGGNAQVYISLSVFTHIFSKLPQLRELNINNVTAFDPKILAFTCNRLQRLTISTSQQRSQHTHSKIKDMVNLRQSRARRKGRQDPLAYIKLDGLLL